MAQITNLRNHGFIFSASLVLKRAALLATIALLAACGSSTKLNEVPVEDKQGASVMAPATPASGANDGSQVAQRAVTPGALDSNSSTAAGPANVAKVIYFDYDSSAIKPEFQGALDAHAKFLNANKSRKIALEGHTDDRGGREYNLALGQKRAEAVRRALGLLGVAETQMEAVSFGKEKPANPGSDEASWALNRRAEMAYR